MSRKQRKRRERRRQRARRRHEGRVEVPLCDPPYRGRVPLQRLDGLRWRVPRRGAMRVDGLVYADEALLPDLEQDRCLEQVANVATLPGIVGHSLAMPDIHWGYGFPIGGVAAFDPERGGVVSPGGVGYDINCGVRLLVADFDREALSGRMDELVGALFRAIPAGVGSRRAELAVDERNFQAVLRDGARALTPLGLARPEDLERIEEGGRIAGAEPERVSARALQRGRPQLGTLGSGNHFAEVGYVDEVHDAAAARAFGLREGRVTLMIHSGSRGLGHQVCTDALQGMLRAASRHGIPLVDRQLCCAPVGSPEASDYLAAMAAAANYAFANRQVMAHWAREVFDRFGSDLRTVYDVCHNIAKFEEHVVEGAARRLLVHRKGATRALPAGHPLLPPAYRAVGQPVVIPGDMGRCSYVLVGGAGSTSSFASACHGAGRLLSRAEAKRRYANSDVSAQLRARGVVVRGASRATVVEEVPEAYKDVAEVVHVVHEAGLARKVARLRPLGCLKG
ncbi:MAG: RtcB family protein [Planctomycetota bacterium]|nr:MAG: RtcB family protein [Planctomycetota bacterium]